MSFYRTYRPQSIQELDSQRVREQIFSLIKKPLTDLPHAFLLVGPKGSGKTTTARILAKLFTCENVSSTTGPCGVCVQCIAVKDGTSMDVIEMDGASNRGIDEIRNLREHIALAPSSASHKIIIIDEVHMLTTEAFNALLKTLEEPPEHVIFILATTDPQKVPATIQSRCMIIRFSKANVTELLHALSTIVEKEKLLIHPDALKFITSVADGAFRDAVKLLEQASMLDGEITVDRITDMLSMTDSSMVVEWIDLLVHGQQKEAIRRLEMLVSEGKDIRFFISDVLDALHAQIVKEIQSDSFQSNSKLSFIIDQLIAAYGLMRVSPLDVLPCIPAVIRICEHTQTHIPEPVIAPSVVSTIHPPTMTPKIAKLDVEKKAPEEEKIVSIAPSPHTGDGDTRITLEKLTDGWKDLIEALKPYNHSVAGVMRSARPKNVDNGIVTIETLYAFHQERLSEPKVRDILATVLKKLFGVSVQVHVVLTKK